MKNWLGSNCGFASKVTGSSLLRFIIFIKALHFLGFGLENTAYLFYIKSTVIIPFVILLRLIVCIEWIIVILILCIDVQWWNWPLEYILSDFPFRPLTARIRALLYISQNSLLQLIPLSIFYAFKKGLQYFEYCIHLLMFIWSSLLIFSGKRWECANFH